MAELPGIYMALEIAQKGTEREVTSSPTVRLRFIRLKAPGPTDSGGHCEKMEEPRSQSIQVAIRGVLVHQGIEGYEPADQAAKKQLYGY